MYRDDVYIRLVKFNFIRKEPHGHQAHVDALKKKKTVCRYDGNVESPRYKLTPTIHKREREREKGGRRSERQNKKRRERDGAKFSQYEAPPPRKKDSFSFYLYIFFFFAMISSS